MQPQTGDIILRANTASGFELVDAVTHHRIAGPWPDLQPALDAATSSGARAIWHQNVDHRGRVLGEPFQLAIVRACTTR